MVLLDGVMDFWEVGTPGVLQVSRTKAIDSSPPDHCCSWSGSFPPQPPPCSTRCSQSGSFPPQLPSCSTKCTKIPPPGSSSHMCQPPRMLGEIWSCLGARDTFWQCYTCQLTPPSLSGCTMGVSGNWLAGCLPLVTGFLLPSPPACHIPGHLR